MVRAVKIVFDGKKSSLLMLASDRVGSVHAQSQPTKKRFTEKKVDKDLLGSYQAPRFSYLGLKLLDRIDVVVERGAREEFHYRLFEAAEVSPEINSDDFALVAASFFQRLVSVGRVCLNA